MSFIWPQMLPLLLLVPVLVAIYIFVLRRRKKVALKYSSLSIVKEALDPGQRIRRHLPPLLFLLGLTAMLLAVARPVSVVTLPTDKKTVILAMDVSGSMRATDLQPNRLVASQEAARNFVAALPGTARIGVVTFAGSAALVQPPTVNRDEVLAAIDRFQTQPATAVGSGILVSLQAIFPEAGFSLNANLRQYEEEMTSGGSGTTAEAGSGASAAIILLTDGQTTIGPDPVEAARVAAARGVRIYTVGIGTEKGEIVRGDGWAMQVGLDETTLKTIANLTDSEYFRADSGGELQQVYEKLNSRIVFETRSTEITPILAGVAAALTMLAGLLSLLWFNRVL
jgi:Ca-activated chloride channel family protein